MRYNNWFLKRVYSNDKTSLCMNELTFYNDQTMRSETYYTIYKKNNDCDVWDQVESYNDKETAFKRFKELLKENDIKEY